VVRLPRADVVAVTAGPRTVALDGFGRAELPGNAPAAMLSIGSATPLTAWVPSSRLARPRAPSAVYDCNNYEPRPAKELGLRLQTLADRGSTVLRLSARDHAACTRIELLDATAGRTYRVQMQYRTVTGKRPEVCLWQIGTDGCSLTPRAPIADGWTSYDQVVTVDSVASGLQVVLYANVGVRLGDETITEYRDVRITALDAAMRTSVFPQQVPPATVDLLAGEHELAVVGGPSGSVLQDFGPLEDCYNTDDRGFEAAGLSVKKLGTGASPAFQLTAVDHRACIAAPVPDMGNSSAYELSFDARSVNLRDPQVCLYQRGPDRCTSIPRGGPWKDWTHYSVRVTPDPTSVETRLYLYGLRDLAGLQQAVVEYRDVALRPVASAVDVVMVREAPAAPPATVRWSKTSTARFAAVVEGATPLTADGTGTVLALNESWAPGWRAESATGLVAGTRPKVQGWMNGWATESTRASASLIYGPDRIAKLALLLFPVSLAFAVLWLLSRRRVRAAVGGWMVVLGRCLPARGSSETSS
jgi:arabinofuranan 3-O-arabinosyltransferase